MKPIASFSQLGLTPRKKENSRESFKVISRFVSSEKSFLVVLCRVLTAFSNNECRDNLIEINVRSICAHYDWLNDGSPPEGMFAWKLRNFKLRLPANRLEMV